MYWTSAAVLLSIAAVLSLAIPVAADEALRLKVSDSGRYLVDGNGEPFFWLGDTGWAMFSALTLDEAETYLENRRTKGFNVIQCIIAHWSAGDLRVSPEGHAPWTDNNPLIPNGDYLDRVKTILAMAAEKGIVLALLPAWGDFVTQDRVITANNAYDYGHLLGTYFADDPNIVWVLGGDRPATGFEDVFGLLAAGLADGDGGGHIMTYHPRGGGASSEWFQETEWLDFNMVQSGHGKNSANYAPIARDYARTPIKPILDGEPGYENIIHGLRDAGPRLDDHDVRKTAYNAVLSGALGHTYGCNGIFQFSRPGERAAYAPNIGWEEAMDLPGAADMGRLKQLMLSRKWHLLEPDQSIVVSGSGSDGFHVPAARARNGSFALIYIPELQAVEADMGRIRGMDARAHWFNPRSGESTEIGVFPNEGTKWFLPPTGPEDPDYVLVLEPAAPDTAAPTIAHLIAGGDPNRIVLRFSETIDPASAAQAGNYTLAPEALVEAASIDTSGSLVTLRTSTMEAGREYTLGLTGLTDEAIEPNPVADGTEVKFTYLTQPPRAVADLQALYLFEGAGPTVRDVSGNEDPMDLLWDDSGSPGEAGGVIRVTTDTLIATKEPAARLVAACRASNEVTIEAWLTPANVTQGGPARAITLSLDTSARNFTLGQAADTYDVRLRTTTTGLQGTPSLTTPPGSLTRTLTHVVYTRDSSGLAKVRLNGEEVASLTVPGDFSNWEDFRFGLANEMTRDRAWLGELHLVAIYSRALTQEEVTANFIAGPRPNSGQ